MYGTAVLCCKKSFDVHVPVHVLYSVQQYKMHPWGSRQVNQLVLVLVTTATDTVHTTWQLWSEHQCQRNVYEPSGIVQQPH